MFTAVLSRIARTEVTHVYLPVAALRPLVQTAASRGTRLPALRYLCVSGEQLIVDDEIRDFFLAHPHCTLVNLYGPTETHAVTSHRLSYRDAVWPTHVPIGQPYPRVSAYVVDATGHLAPARRRRGAAPGRDCPADGYINDPEITAERFVPDRFSGAPRRDHVPHRGPRGARRPGRPGLPGPDDTQVKIRGYRIEPGRDRGRRQPGRRRPAGGRGGPGAGADRELGLFVRPDADSTVDPEQVRQRLTTTLPVYMRPLWIFPVHRVPTTPTGKTDRDALLRLADELLVEQQSADTAEVAYADELERELAGLWGGVLDVEGIRPDRPLIEYGAHSLNIFTTLAEVQERYGVAVPLVDFFAAPTVATLAGLVRAARGGDRGGDAVTTRLPGRPVPLLRRGARPACVLLPGAGGGLHPYLRLAAAIGKTHNVAAVRAAGLLPDEEPELSIAEMADAAARALDADGTVPAAVLGWSLGGSVALGAGASGWPSGGTCPTWCWWTRRRCRAAPRPRRTPGYARPSSGCSGRAPPRRPSSGSGGSSTPRSPPSPTTGPNGRTPAGC